MKTVIFDLDGTLVDTSRDLIAAANACFQGLALGDLLDPVADMRIAFGGGRAMLRLGFERAYGAADEAMIDAQYAVLLDHYEGHIADHSTLFPGTMEAVRELKNAGYSVGICTNKPEGLAQMLMVALGVRDEFASLVGADTLPVRKPDPAPYVESVVRLGGSVAQSCLVGDTNTDRKTAAAAGVPCILVTFGQDAREDVTRLKPEGIIDTFGELLGEVQRLIG